MQFSGYVQTIDVDLESYTASLIAALKSKNRKGAAAFVRIANKEVPVQTGMARGSFLNLGRYLRSVGLNPDLEISPKEWRKKDGKGGPTYYHTTGSRPTSKDPEHGARLANFSFEQAGARVKFNFDTRVRHYNEQDEAQGLSPTSPWHSFELGRQAYLREMATIKQDLPRISGFFVKTKVSIGSGNTSSVSFPASTMQRTIK